MKPEDKKILLVGNPDTGLTELLQKLLIEETYQTDIAYGGFEGLDKINNWRPDIVVSEIVMPPISGFEMFIRLQGNQNSVPVIFIADSVKILPRMRELGVRHSMLTPVCFDNLLSKINNILFTENHNVLMAAC